MKTKLVSLAIVATLAIAVSSRVERRVPERTPTPPPNAEGTRLVNRLPVAFVPNLGQWDHDARFVTRVGAMTVFLEDRGWSFTLVERTGQGKKESREPRHDDAPARGVAVRMTFVGAQQPELVAEQVLPGKHNYFLGNDATKWRSDVPLYGSVRYRGMHDGVDVRAREHDGNFEYDLLLAPDADLAPVEVVVDGIDRLHVDREGALVMETVLGPVRMPVPVSWEEGPNGEQVPVACHYVLRGANRFGFEAAGRRPGWALTVDPGLVYSTFLGGAGFDRPRAIALDAQGAATVAGDTNSTNFPTTLGAFDTSLSGGDAFVTRLSPSGASLIYSTFLGGSNNDYAYAIAIDAHGAATIAGNTHSLDFPTTPGAFDTSNAGLGDAFITGLSPTGSSLVYSTFLGGNQYDGVTAIAIDVQGAATVAGETRLYGGFPTTPGALSTPQGNRDIFVTRLSPTGSSLVYSARIGGGGNDYAHAIALDALGAATVAGRTQSNNFPTTPGAFDTSLDSDDAFVLQLSPTGSSLIYSTFLGGTGGETSFGIALDALGAATIAGTTTSADFPVTPGAFNTSPRGGFVARLSPTGSTLEYATFFGGIGYALALDAQGGATVAGHTYSNDLPTTPGAFDTSGNAYDEAFVARLSPTGSSLVYSTFLGGAGADRAMALALDAQGGATVAGYTDSTNFPTTPGAFGTSFQGGTYDVFVTRLDMLPTGVNAFGASSPGCTGPLAISVTSMPQVGNTQFAITCGNAAPSTVGLITFARARLQSPVSTLGVDIWLDPPTLLVSATVTSNATGACNVPLPIANNPALAGLRLFTQFLWLGPNAPPPCPPRGFSTSNALDFTIQP